MGHLEDLEEMLLLLRDSVEKLLKNPTETYHRGRADDGRITL